MKMKINIRKKKHVMKIDFIYHGKTTKLNKKTSFPFRKQI